VYDYHRNDWAKAALAYLLHNTAAAPSRSPSPRPGTGSRYLSPSLATQSAAPRLGQGRLLLLGTISSKGAHFGGQGSGVCGFVVPTRSLDREPEPLIYLHPLSITGELKVTDRNGKSVVGPFPADTYRFHRDDAGFRTVGTVPTGPVEQACAFFSFADGPAVFFNSFKAMEACRLSWSGMPVYFFVRPGLTSARIYADAENGKRPLEKPLQSRSDWWSVDDVLGVAAKGGSGRIEVSRQVGRDWAAATRTRTSATWFPFADPRLPLPSVKAPANWRRSFTPYRSRPGRENQRKTSESRDGIAARLGGIVAADAKDAGRRYLA